MKLTFEVKNDAIEEMIDKSVAIHLLALLQTSAGQKAIRDGTREYLIQFNLLQFIKKIKK